MIQTTTPVLCLVLALGVTSLAAPVAEAQTCTGNFGILTLEEGDVLDCEVLDGNLFITGNVNDLSPLSKLTTVLHNVTIYQTANLETLNGLTSLQRIDGTLRIVDNDALTSLAGLEALRWVWGLQIGRNNQLETLDGLDPAPGIVHSVRVHDNPQLRNLNALAPIHTIVDRLAVGGNPLITNLDAFSGLTNLGRLSIVGNEALRSCSCGLSGLTSDGQFVSVGSLNFSSNASDGSCNTPQQVLDDPCVPTASEHTAPTDTFVLTVAPNPVTGHSTVAFELAKSADVTVSLYDALGRQVAILAEAPYSAGRHTVELATADLPVGVYVVRAQFGETVRTARLTVIR